MRTTLFALALLCSHVRVFALCKSGAVAPSEIPVVGTAIGTSQTAATVSVGPGGPIYLQVRNSGDIGASFLVVIMKKGTTLDRAFCKDTAIVAPGEEYWLQATFAGDEVSQREVDAFTGVEGASLELTVFKEMNILPPTITDTVTIRLRAFLPKTFPAPDGYIRPIPGQHASSMIQGPLPEVIKLLPVDSIKAAADCFATDNRDFTSGSAAPSKGSTEFQITIYYGQVSIQPSDPRAVHQAGISTRLDCSTGASLAQKPGTFAPPFGVRAIGKPSADGTKVEIAGQVGIGNPHVLGAPMIDYSFDLIYDASVKKLAYSVTIGAFPAFEFYAIHKGEAPITILQLPPQADTAWGLIDGGVGLNTMRYSGTVQF